MKLLRGIAVIQLLALLAFGCGTDPGVDNQPPTITVDVPPSISYTVGEGVIRIMVTGDDPEGEPVSVGVSNPPPRANFENYGNWGIFTWDPIASDVTVDRPLELIFTASDDFGLTAERVVRVSIVAGNGVPRFTNSPSILHNVDSGKPVQFDVIVRDDDSQRVAIAMPTGLAPEGAEFLVTGDFTGRFTWEPTADQLKFRVHSVTFTAADGVNPPVEQKVSILLKKEGEQSRPELPESPTDPTGCAFEDAVRHTPLPAQRGSQDYPVEVQLTQQAAERYDRVVLNYTSEDIWNIRDTQLTGSEMTEENGVYRASIPNPTLPGGESREIYYEICAIDDDSQEDDAILCGPTNLYNAFIAYSPDNDGRCIDDAFVNRTFDAAWPLNDGFGWEHHRACGDQTPDYFSMELAPWQNGDVLVTYPFGAGVEVEMYDENRNLLPVEASACSGFVFAFVENQTDQPTTRYFRVTGTDVPYQISPWFYDPAPMNSCVATDSEPNDTAAQATPLTLTGDPMPEQEVCGPMDVDIFSFIAAQGELIDVKIDFVHADGDLDLKLFAPRAAAAVDTNGTATRASLGIGDQERIEYVADESGVWNVLVFGYGTGNKYTITGDVGAPQMCVDNDMFAGNQTRETAQDLPLQTHSGLKICPGSQDWYKFQIFSNEVVFVSLTVSSGNIDDVVMKLWDGATEDATATRNGSALGIDIAPTSNTLYHLSVEAPSEVTYSLSFSFFI